MPLVTNDWRELSKAASQEYDPRKLMELIDQLNQAFEQMDEKCSARRFAQEHGN